MSEREGKGRGGEEKERRGCMNRKGIRVEIKGKKKVGRRVRE